MGQIKFTKNGVGSSFLGSEKFFKKVWEKIQHATKEPFFSLFLQQQQKILETLGQFFFNFFCFLKGFKNLK